MQRLHSRSFLFLFLGLSTSLLLQACAKDAARIATQALPESLAVSVANSSTGVVVNPADSSRCPAGGAMIQLFRDSNSNGVFDSGETILSETPVCNGLAGSSGQSAGLSLTQASSGACPADGSLLRTFTDLNQDGILNSNETITSVSTLCNGVNGTNGTSGSNGASSSLTASAASNNQCPSGGVVYTATVDGHSPQINVVCNGTDSSFQMGSVGSKITDVLSACHHDFLYLPNAINPERAWLNFRHQKNGSLDQGIGLTGFNVWSVDVSDFFLISENGSEVYCQLHYEPSKKTLSYLVTSKLDGRAGEKGEIQFR